MCLEQTPEMEQHANWLLDIGAGLNLDNTEKIAIPPHMLCSDHEIDSLMNQIYPDMVQGDQDDQYFLDRNILACTNDSVMHLNEELLKKFPGDKHIL